MVQLAHERDLIVLPVAFLLFLASFVYCVVELNRRYVRWRNASAVIRIAVIAPWLDAESVARAVAAASANLQRAGHTVLTVPSAFDAVTRLMAPQCVEPALLPQASSKDAIRADAPITTAAAVLRLALANEDEARLMAAGTVRSRRFATGAQTVPAEKDAAGLTVELCMGGALDAEALCESKLAWSRVWHRTGWRKPKLVKRYDAVVLVTARDSAERAAPAAIGEHPPSSSAMHVASRRASLWMGHPHALTTSDGGGDAVSHEVHSAVLAIQEKRRGTNAQHNNNAGDRKRK